MRRLRPNPTTTLDRILSVSCSCICHSVTNAPFTTYKPIIRLTHFKYADHEATDLIRFLIRVLAHDASSARRNSLTVFKLVETFLTISNGLGDLINEVDNETEANSWDAYDAFTDAIHPLEELLFEVVAFTEKPEFSQFLPTDSPVAALVDSVDTWESTRRTLRNFLDRAYEGFPKLLIVSGRVYAEETHDDLVLLSALCEKIKTHPLTDHDVRSRDEAKSITQLKDTAGAIHSLAKSASGAELEQGIRSTMLVYAAMVASKSTTQTQSASNVRSSRPIWEQAAKLLTHTKGHLTKPPTRTLPPLDPEWHKLKDLLTKLEATLPPEYLELRKLARTVRRPYHARTLLLVDMCKELGDHFLKPGNFIAGKIPPLQDALDAAINAIKEGSQKFSAITKDLDTTLVDEAFNEALGRIDKSFTEYSLTSRKEEMIAALAKDKEHVQRLNENFDAFNGKQKALVSSSVTVEVSGKSKTYTVDANDRLSTILWLLADEPKADRKMILRASHFKQGSTRLEFDDTVPQGSGILKLI